MASAHPEPTPQDAPRPQGAQLPTTKKRVLTRRGVMWLGQTCNLRCYFCYFIDRIANKDHPQHAFMTLDKAKAICDTLRTFYGDTAIDIQGGEPTIYPEILELCQHCHDIGLYPTLITNGLYLSKEGRLEAYREHGVRDFLVSLHGLDAIHDEVVGRKGAATEIIKSIERMRELDIPFRFNCTMSEPVVPLLTQIAQKAIDYGAFVVNYIAFNPFGDQNLGGHRTARNVPRYADIKPQLTEAIDMLEEAGIEVNVRYLPLCMAEPRHRKNFYNFQQLPYDTHEWNYESWMWTMMSPQMQRKWCLGPTIRTGWTASWVYRGNHHWPRYFSWKHPHLARMVFTAQHAAAQLNWLCAGGKENVLRREARIRARRDCLYRYHDKCKACAARYICDGFHGDYADFFGTDEATTIADVPTTNDPKFFIKEQDKYVEIEDQDWAL